MAETTLPRLRVSEKEARQKIEARIEEGQQLCDRPINSESELDQAIMESDNWSSYNTDLLMGLFDSSALADQHTNFCYSRLDDEEIYDRRMLNMHVPDLKDEVKEYQERMARSISSLKGIHGRLELYREPSDMSQSTFGNKVFIVHGHDEAAKHAVARFVAKFDIEPIILDERASRGQTIIDKFEESAGEAGFAIVLLTPDDVAARKGESKIKPRARQNVILELGYFLGRLGRERVRVLHKEKVELPSDIHGIIYVTMDNSNGWQLELGKEMKKAGLPVDLNELA